MQLAIEVSLVSILIDMKECSCLFNSSFPLFQCYLNTERKVIPPSCQPKQQEKFDFHGGIINTFSFLLDNNRTVVHFLLCLCWLFWHNIETAILFMDQNYESKCQLKGDLLVWNTTTLWWLFSRRVGHNCEGYLINWINWNWKAHF